MIKNNKIINEYLTEIELSSDYVELIKKFENEIQLIKPDEAKGCRLQFYRKILENVVDKKNVNESSEVVTLVLENIEKSKDNYEIYQIKMDSYILLAIKLYFNKNIIQSKEWFEKSITFGEENKELSKQNYYDSLNCAYSWLGAILYAYNDLNNAYDTFNKAIDNYNEVKDDPNYKVKETEVIKTCENYIVTIKQKLNQL